MFELDWLHMQFPDIKHFFIRGVIVVGNGIVANIIYIVALSYSTDELHSHRSKYQ